MNNRNFYIKVLTGPALSGLILTLLITCEKPERVVEFTTLEAQASNISYTTATLKGEITDAGSKPMEDHGILVSSNPNPRVGNATVKSLGSRTTKGIFSVNVTELTTNTTYYFRSYVTIEGVDTYADKICNFKTKDYAPPTVITGAATSVTATSATLEGTVNANDLSTTVTFEYGLTTSYGSEVTAAESPVTGTSTTNVSADLTGLTSGTTYHFRVKAVNSEETSYGDDMTFTTGQAPTAVTGSATSVTTTSATLAGTVNANGYSTTVTFEYGLTTSYGSEVTAAESPVTGTIITNVSANLTGLNSGTTYHYRVKAVSFGGTTYGNDMTFAATEQVADGDGNIYNTVQISTQLWIQENLKTTHYNNGDIIANITDNTAWSELGSGAYCWYDNDEGTYKDPYGALYTWWTTVDVRNICPAGWHVPTDAEWTTITDYLGGESVAGGKLKETGTTHWTSPNTGATNETGFTALPGGSRSNDGTFNNIGNYGYYWSSTESSSGSAWSWNMSFENADAYRNNNNRQEYGYSVRCVKGELPLAQTDDATAVTAATATLNGQVNPNYASTTVTFEYGMTTSYGYEVTASESPIEGTTPASVSYGITGLGESITYHYRVKAVNTGGTTYSADMTFTTTTTIEAPSATTGSATSVTTTTATLNGTVNPNDLSTTVTFEYGLTTSYGSEAAAAESPVTGSTSTSVTAAIGSLTASTTYHYRTKAVSTGGTTYGDDMEFITLSLLPTVTDYDGNEYNIITIGTQDWIQENLKTTHYNNGDVIANITDNTEWNGLTTGAYCWYDNDEGTYKDTYGALYNWYTTVDARNVCPAGWHVPTDAEWTILTDYLGGESVAGGKLKETGTSHWNSPNTDATNETGFTALGGGKRNNDGLFDNLMGTGFWWSSSYYTSAHAWRRKMDYSNGSAERSERGKVYGFSIRCIKGELPLAQTEEATAVTASSATLNGQVNPNNASTSVTFEYGETTSYGSEVTAAESPVTGSTATSVSASISSLTASTTYHYRVKAVSTGGITYGEDVEFTTSATTQAPSATTNAASSVTTTAATLNGTVNANNLSTTVTFEYGLSTSYGSEITAAESPVTGSTSTSVTAAIGSLAASTTYHYRIKAVSAGGATYGDDMDFTTLSLPSATTGSATSITGTTATLDGTVNANDLSTTVTFEYGLTTSYGSEVTAAESPVTGNTSESVTAAIESLAASTTYHYRVKAISAGGTTYGNDMEFTTLSLPSATTGSASAVTSTSATLEGTVNANDLSTTVTFEYGLTTAYGTEVTADESPVTGSTATAVSYDLGGLTASTTYHYRVKAVSAGGTTYGDDITFNTPEQVTDADGNTYNSVIIGTQIWIQENLKTTHYTNSDIIANITNNTEWEAMTSGAYCWYDNDETTYKSTYGALYNWYTTVDVRNVCPAGWHVPTDAEWTILTDYLGGGTIAGGKLKESGTDHWTSPNTSATNETGFTALPGGNRLHIFSHIGDEGYFWASTEYSSTNSYFRILNYNSGNVLFIQGPKEYGSSIRCIKGELPLTRTNTATAVTSVTANLKGVVNPNGVSTSVSFEYGETTTYGLTVDAIESPFSGSIPFDVSADLTSLTPGTEYHYRVKAENSGGTNYGSDMTVTTPEQVTDADGNVYNTVIIGTQIWMQENLKTTQYNDETSIPLVTDETDWATLTTPSYCWYNNDQTTYGDTYGALYKWYTLNTGILCPAGWHVPTDAEWTTLTDYLGGLSVAGGKLKEAGTIHWTSPNTGATNETDFTALPSGMRYDDGSFNSIHGFSSWWSSTESSTNAWYYNMGYNRSDVARQTYTKIGGFSVRCVKD